MTVKRLPASASLEERYWLRVTPSDGCWEWIGPRDHSGYGVLKRYRESDIQAHRLAWIVNYGPIPDGMLVCHRCDNPPCARPDHLFLGTHADNARDKVQKGRARVKITAAAVRAIRRAVADGERMTDLASRHGISPSMVSRIASRRRWSHVD